MIKIVDGANELSLAEALTVRENERKDRRYLVTSIDAAGHEQTFSNCSAHYFRNEIKSALAQGCRVVEPLKVFQYGNLETRTQSDEIDDYDPETSRAQHSEQNGLSW